MSTVGGIGGRIRDELVAALDDLLAQNAVRDTIRRSDGLQSRLRAAVDDIGRSAISATPLRQRPRIALGSSSAFQCRVNGDLKQASEATHAVIVPLANESHELRSRCVASIQRNFDPARCIVVLYSQEPCPYDALLPGFTVATLINEGPFALPQAYNRSVGWLRDTFGARFDDLVLVFLDDDAEIVGEQRRAIDSLVRMVTDGECLLASGHYFDFRPPPDIFARAIDVSGAQDFVRRVPKPYCHGGAALMMRGATFPSPGLPETGLGGISLGILAIESLCEDWSRRIDSGGWYLHNNPALAVQHPRKGNILQWAATYLGYTRAWNSILDGLSATHREHWTLRLDAGRKARREALLEQSGRNGDEHALTNLLLTDSFKRRVVARFNHEDFRQAGLSVHPNLT